MTEIVINTVHGGFSVSVEAMKLLLEKRGKKTYFYARNLRKKSKEVYNKTPVEKIKKRFYYVFDKDMGDNIDRGESRLDDFVSDYDMPRDDKNLVAVVKELGNKANGLCAELKVVTIPDDVEWTIEEYDGLEWIAEKHRTWG